MSRSTCHRWKGGFGCDKDWCESSYGTVHPSNYDVLNECHRWQRGQECRSTQFAAYRPMRCWRIHRPPVGFEGEAPPWRPKSSAAPPPPPPPGAPPSSSYGFYPPPPSPSGPPPRPASSSGSSFTGPPPPPSGSASTGSAPTATPPPTSKAPPPTPGSLCLRDVVRGLIQNTPAEERRSKARTLLLKFHPDRNLDVELQAFFHSTVLFLTEVMNAP